MEINIHLKQGLLHYLQITSKYPHVQTLFPQPQLSEKDLLAIVQNENYSSLSKEAKFFFTIISVFSCGNYTPAPLSTLPEGPDVLTLNPSPASDVVIPQLPVIDAELADLLAAAMPK